MIVFPGLIFSLITLLTAIWAERKIAAKIQMRFGPYYASKRIGGYFQLIADAIKFGLAEIIVPSNSIREFFILGPILITAFAFLPMAFIPVSQIPSSGSITSPYYRFFFDKFAGISLYQPIITPYSLLFIIAVASVVPILTVMTAWASNNRFSLISAIREGILTVAYDTLIIIALISMGIEYHTLDIASIVKTGVPGIIANPIAAFVFFVALLMGTARFPFDVAEADTELVTGAFTEYSGLLFVLSMAGPYLLTFVYSLVFATVFLGGWLPLMGIPGAILTVIKALIILFFSVFMRSVYGRYRIDQILRGGWKYFFPAALLALIIGMIGGIFL
ncbi:NADH-quinone oxidoreductase subunit H [Sulfolobales archaeon HS-7]|nr:NADH-quinone oxidoreductase subunit H [Sulfolobales archaeon HS-7]